MANESDQKRAQESKSPLRDERPRAKRSKKAKSRNRKNKSSSTGSSGRRPGPKPYPIITFEQALRIGQGIADFGSGHPTKRTTLLEKLGLPFSQSTKDLITASSKYGITSGSHDASYIKLTEDGLRAVASEATIERTRARIKLAIIEIEPFRRLYEKFQGRKLPAVEVLRDSLEDLNEGDRAPCVDIFVQNAKFVGILQTREGAEFIAAIEDASTRLPATRAFERETAGTSLNQPSAGEDFDTVCFFIAPIGADASEHRRHSDAILSSYVEKALHTVDPELRVVRADKITQPGIITKQVIEYLINSKLVVADLSYHNPNVFYELAVRHATGKPIIHIKRSSDSLPFDNKDFRTIDINFEDKFDILAEIETVRSTIAQFSRQALGSDDSSDNPLLIYFPDHRFAKHSK